MPFNPVTAADVAHLTAITAPGRVRTGDDIPEDYTRDEMPIYGSYAPEVLVEAKSTGEVSKVLAYANERHIPVTPRGAGTGLCGACVPVHGGILLSLAGMNRILEVDAENLTATVEPGVLLMQLGEQLAPLGLLYPPDPGEKTATIGGNCMTNAGGMRAVKYGVTRDYILGLEAVLPSGEVVQLGGGCAKSSSGYSLLQLLVGSEGTLAVVTKLTLKLIPLPARFVSLLVPFESLANCMACVQRVLHTGNLPTTLEYVEREVLEEARKYLGKGFPHASAAAYLIVSYHGASAAELKPVIDTVAEACLAAGAEDVFISDTKDRQDAIWDARGAFLEAISSSTPLMDECDVVVGLAHIEEFVAYTKQLAKEYNVRIRSFGHAGDGNLHVYVCKDDLPDAVWRPTVQAVMDALYARARELGGQVSGEHGIGHAKRGYLAQSLGEGPIALMRGIKAVFDPAGILNPGKVI